jgi:hypothetical protein
VAGAPASPPGVGVAGAGAGAGAGSAAGGGGGGGGAGAGFFWPPATERLKYKRCIQKQIKKILI